MRSGSRLSERWFTLALWLVALVFAWFLIGLGSLVVGDLPQVEHRYTLDQFLDTDQGTASAEALKQIRREQDDNRRKVEQDQLALEAAQSASEGARETFANWLKTRDATQRVDQDPGLVARTQQLDALKAAERSVEERLAALARTGLDLSEREAAQLRVDNDLRAAAQARLDAAERGQELRVFGYRLDVPARYQEMAAWTAISMFPGRTNKGGWDKPQYYRTLLLVNRHTCSDVVLGSRAAAGAVATIFNTKTQTWRSMQSPSNNACFSDVAGFDQASCYETCRVVVDGADVLMCGRGTKGYYVQLLTPL